MRGKLFDAGDGGDKGRPDPLERLLKRARWPEPEPGRIERLWRFMRGQMTKNQFYETLEHLCRAVYEWLLTVPFAQFCSLMGLDEAELGFVENLCS